MNKYEQYDDYFYYSDEFIKDNCPKEFDKYTAIMRLYYKTNRLINIQIFQIEEREELRYLLVDLFVKSRISKLYFQETVEMGTNIDRTYPNGTREEGELTCLFLLLTRYVELRTMYQLTLLYKQQNEALQVLDNPYATHLSVANETVSTAADFMLFYHNVESQTLFEQQQVILKQGQDEYEKVSELIFKTTKYFRYVESPDIFDVYHLLVLLVEGKDGLYKEKYYIYNIKDLLKDEDTRQTWVTKKKIEKGEYIDDKYIRTWRKFGQHSLVFIDNFNLSKYCKCYISTI